MREVSATLEAMPILMKSRVNGDLAPKMDTNVSQLAAASAQSKLICGTDRGILGHVKEVVCHRSLLCSWAVGIANDCVR